MSGLKIPRKPVGDNPVTLGVGEPFTTTLTVTFYFALIISLPVILLELYGFILPALSPTLKSAYGLSLTEIGVVLGAIGIGMLFTLLPWGLVADRFGMPVLTLVDTSGAYPGIDAEARGQAEAVATSIDTCLSLGVPLVSVVIGEGGSGGALAIASADRVYMLENSVYSVISPEGCASILWRDNANAQDAAEAMKVTAGDLKKLEVIDEVIPEPMGGAHRAPEETIDLVGKVVSEALGELSQFDAETLRRRRQEKFLAMGKKGL